MHTDFIIAAFILGIVVAIPPGSVTIIACQRALQFGFRNSLLFTLGSCLSDIFYLALVYSGVGTFIASNNSYKLTLWFVSGTILFLIGGSSLFSLTKKKQNSHVIDNFQKTRFATFFSGVVITLTNPMTIVGWMVIAGNFYLIWSEKYPDINDYGVPAIMIIMLGVMVWFLPMIFIVGKIGKMIKEKAINILILVGNLFLLLFGCMAFYYAIKSI